jgi:hypothetical protein
MLTPEAKVPSDPPVTVSYAKTLDVPPLATNNVAADTGVTHARTAMTAGNPSVPIFISLVLLNASVALKGRWLIREID